MFIRCLSRYDDHVLVVSLPNDVTLLAVCFCCVFTGSPGQLSPGASSVAPTIPTAPHSPRDDLDSFDFDKPFDFFTFPASLSLAASHNALSGSAASNKHGFTPQQSQPARHSNSASHYPSTPSSAPALHYGGSLDQGMASLGASSSANPYTSAYERSLNARRQQPTSASAASTRYDDVMTRSMPSTQYSGHVSSSAAQQQQRPHSGGTQSLTSQRNTLQDQLDYVSTKSSSRDRENFLRDPYNFERPKTTPPSLDASSYSSSSGRGAAADPLDPYIGLQIDNRYASNVKQQPQQLMTSSKQQPQQQQVRAGAGDANVATRQPQSSTSSTATSSLTGAQRSTTQEPRYPM